MYSSLMSTQLDDDGSINDLKIKEIGGVKYIFVTTMSKIYRLPLERCERHETCLYVHSYS